MEARADAKEEVSISRCEKDATDALINSLSRRLCACSQVLSRLAEKDGPAGEALRMRAVLERIASMGGEAGEMARRELGW